MEATTHIRTSKKTYYGAIILCTLFAFGVYTDQNVSFFKIISSIPGVIVTAIFFYCFYKIFFGNGKIILTASGFKLRGYDWTNWEELAAVYPSVEQGGESESHFIKFRLKDGTDLSVRSEYLEISFEQIAALVNQYRTQYKLNDSVHIEEQV